MSITHRLHKVKQALVNVSDVYHGGRVESELRTVCTVVAIEASFAVGFHAGFYLLGRHHLEPSLDMMFVTDCRLIGKSPLRLSLINLEMVGVGCRIGMILIVGPDTQIKCGSSKLRRHLHLTILGG